jgi:hypothetical protein
VSAIAFHIEGLKIFLNLTGIRCLYSGNALAILDVERGAIRRAHANLRGTALRRVSEFFCTMGSNNNETIDGNFAITPALSVILI